MTEGNINLEPEVIYEDKNFLAVNKPAGLLVHAARTAANHKMSLRGSEATVAISRDRRAMNGTMARDDSITLVDWLLEHYPEVRNVGDAPDMRPGIVHRLDRDTSGVMLVARNQAYFEYLKGLFSADSGSASGGQERKIKKTYLAVVHGVPKEKQGIIDRPLGIKQGTIKRTVHSEKMAKTAITEYRVISYKTWDDMEHAAGNAKHGIQKNSLNSRPHVPRELTLLEVYPKTGRTHQIRVHLASIGHPIVGDRLYGKSQIANRKDERLVIGDKRGDTRYAIRDTPRLMLHALSLEFETEPGKRIRIEAEPPSGFLENPQILSSNF